MNLKLEFKFLEYYKSTTQYACKQRSLSHTILLMIRKVLNSRWKNKDARTLYIPHVQILARIFVFLLLDLYLIPFHSGGFLLLQEGLHLELIFFLFLTNKKFQVSEIDKVTLALKCIDVLKTNNNSRITTITTIFKRQSTHHLVGLEFFLSSVSKNDSILKVISKNVNFLSYYLLL